MPRDPATELVGVYSRFQYRAESLARAVSEHTGWRINAVKSPDPAILSAFDIVLVDLDTTVEAALELIRGIAARRPQAKVVALGFSESEDNVVRLAEAGAIGYVPPATSVEQLAAILRSVERNEFACPPNITYALYAHLAKLAGAGRAMRQLPILTMREQRVLELLSQSLTNKEIAANLCISEYTAKNHVHRILKKLGWHSRAAALDYRRHPSVVLPVKSGSVG